MMALSSVPKKTENRIAQYVQKRLAAGETGNRLIKELSPYLLQHAFNPVEWYPWGEEAFAKAKNDDKPIFLSIGYSTCHWCHVMAHESFEDPETAALLNKWFVSIKVDREERPDIDQVYMAATQAMTGSGGWPMSIFLLPDTNPFYAGTYFPTTSTAGRPGFQDLLTSIHKAWMEKRGELRDAAKHMVAILEAEGSQPPVAMKPEIYERCFSMLEQSYDGREGGFGQAPKFPRPAALSFLFSYSLATGERKAKEMALFTLEKMAAGGMYDHLGGGFHRYSVDNNWFVPHFEKMLYDQAQLAAAYVDAFLLTHKDLYARIAKETLHYLLRDMRDSGGGFYSAEDADSDDPYSPGQHGEGAFYLWSGAELAERLNVKDAEIFMTCYGVRPGGNVVHDPTHEFSGRNILYRAMNSKEAAAALQVKINQVDESLAASKKVLFEARELRRRPHLDDKVITSWNGMAIGALARGSRILQEPQFLAAATRTATFLKAYLYNSENNSLLRRYRNGKAGLAGQLNDYSNLVDGLLDLYQANHDPDWLQWAMDLTERQIELFWNDEGGFFFDGAEDPSVKIRMRGFYDGAEPAGNSVAAHNLLRLAQLGNYPEWLRMARLLIESFGEVINHYPPALPLMLTVRQQLDAKPLQIVIAGKRGAKDTEALLHIVDRAVIRPLLVLLADGAENQNYLAARLPFMETVSPLGGKATAYVCTDCACKVPVTDPAGLIKLLEEASRPG